MASLICTHCGAPIAVGANGCSFCGTAFSSPSAASVVSAGSSTSSADAEIVALIERGNLLEAMKRYRVAHGVGLKEAKEAVERFARTGRSR